MSAFVQAVSDDSFDAEVLKSEIPVLVDFWAQWCGPCKSLAPTFEKVAAKYQGKVKFLKLDVDQNESTPAKLGVRGIPTLILFKNGAVAATQVGLLNETDLGKFVEENA